jgi:hypothetical protein
MRDTMREHPVGFDKERRNIFDPEEDPEPEQESTVEEPERTNGSDNAHHGKSPDEDAIVAPDTFTSDLKKKEEDRTQTCAREGCTRKPRFDSLFCSDSCGVSALELDLLRSYEESSDIHPSVLRN